MQKLREVFSNRILELAREDSDILVVCTDSRGSAMIGEFAEELPEQFIEVGIAEQNSVTVAAGLASIGKKVFVVGPASFYSTRASEQVKVDVAYSNNNVKIIGISGGISYGALGATHHSVQDIAFMRAIPDLDVIIPADGNQMLSLVEELISNDHPTYVRIGRGAVDDVYPPGIPFPLGKARVLAEGSDISIFACGQLVGTAMQVADLLKQDDYSASVVDMYSIKPMDADTVLQVASKTNCVMTIEEHSRYGGLGGAIAELLAQHDPKPMHIAALPDRELPNGTDQEVFSMLGLTGEKLYGQAVDLIRKGR